LVDLVVDLGVGVAHAAGAGARQGGGGAVAVGLVDGLAVLPAAQPAQTQRVGDREVHLARGARAALAHVGDRVFLDAEGIAVDGVVTALDRVVVGVAVVVLAAQVDLQALVEAAQGEVGAHAGEIGVARVAGAAAGVGGEAVALLAHGGHAQRDVVVHADVERAQRLAPAV